jgi:VanZ family protein
MAASITHRAIKDFEMGHRLIAVAAWASIAVIACATLSHVGVVYAVYEKVSPMIARPAVSSYVHYEHIFAFGVVGVLFCLAYPRSLLLVGCIVLGSAVLLEIAQTITPDRHGTVPDALEKIAGGVLGIVVAKALLVFYRAPEPSRR